MSTVVKGLSIDNGGSEMRVLLNEGKMIDYNKSEAIPVFCSPNRLYKIHEDDFRVKEITQAESVIHVTKAPSEEHVGYYVMGPGSSLYDGKLLELDTLRFKTDSPQFYEQFIYAIGRGLYYSFMGLNTEDTTTVESTLTAADRAQQKVKYQYIPEQKCTNEEVSVVVCLGTNIPLQEHSGKKDRTADFKSRLAGDYTVEFPLCKDGLKRINFKLVPEFIIVMPEGGVCISAFGNKLQDDEYSLVVDLGDVSLDIACFRGKQLTAFDSTSNAGTKLITKMTSALKDEGIKCNEEAAQRALSEGRVKNGNSFIDVVSIAEEVRRDFVYNSMKADIIGVMTTVDIIPQQISKVVVVGRMMDEDAIFTPLAEFIVDSLEMENVSIVRPFKIGRLANLMSVNLFTTIFSKKAREVYEDRN